VNCDFVDVVSRQRSSGRTVTNGKRLPSSWS